MQIIYSGSDVTISGTKEINGAAAIAALVVLMNTNYVTDTEMMHTTTNEIGFWSSTMPAINMPAGFYEVRFYGAGLTEDDWEYVTLDGLGGYFIGDAIVATTKSVTPFTVLNSHKTLNTDRVTGFYGLEIDNTAGANPELIYNGFTNKWYTGRRISGHSGSNTGTHELKAILTEDDVALFVSGGGGVSGNTAHWDAAYEFSLLPRYNGMSVISTNGFAASIATAGTTPAITMSTTVTGILYGNGTAMSAAIAANFPVLNQNTTGSAAKFTTPRTINGVSFDGSANIALTPTDLGLGNVVNETKAQMFTNPAFTGTVTSAGVIQSTLSSGAPFIVASTTKVSNLNVDAVDGYHFDQGVMTTNAPTFAGLTINGNLLVTGTSITENVTTVEIADNLLLLNRNEILAGVQGGTGTAGFEIERGSLANYQFIFDEVTQSFRVGVIGGLQPVATREDNPLNTGFARWNSTNVRYEAFNLFGTGNTWTGQQTFNSSAVILGVQATTTSHAVRADRTLTLTSDTNVTITNSATAQNLTADRSWTLGWAGTLAVGRGGTGLGTFTKGILASPGTTSAFTTIALADNMIPKFSSSYLVASNITDDGTTVSLAVNTNITGNLTFQGAKNLSSTAGITVNPAGVLLFAPTGINKAVQVNNDSYLKSNDYASQTTGWGISGTGSADFRYIYANELHVKTFIADLEQALAGSQIISKSCAPLAVAYTNGATQITVESFAGFPTFKVFADGDYVRLRNIARTSDGGLTVGDVWGTVTYASTAGNTQIYTFTKTSGTVDVPVGSLVLDYGVSGNGFIESTTVDGLWGINSPYQQIVSWTTTPTNQVVNTRLGKLTGITGTANEYGLIAGQGGVTATDKYLLLSNKATQLHNIPLEIYSTSAKRIELLTTGDVRFGTDTSGAGTTSFDFTASSGVLRVGFTGPGKSNMYFDGSKLSLRNDTTDRIALNADGSGFLADGNISWTTAGALSIGSANGWLLTTNTITAGSAGQIVIGAMKLGIAVTSGNNGIAVDANNYWYQGGNFQIYGDANNSFTKAGTAVTMKSQTFTLQGSTTLYIDTTKIAVGPSASGLTVAGTAVGTVFDNAGGFASWGSATDYIRRSGTSLDIKATGFDFIAGTATISQVGINTTRIALGTTLPTTVALGAGVWMDSSGNFRAGTATSGTGYIYATPTSLDIKSASFVLSGSTTLYIDTTKIAVGSSASGLTVAGAAVGTVIDNAGGFSSWGSATNYIRRSGTTLDIQSSSFSLAGSTTLLLNTSKLALGASASALSMTVGTGVYIDTSGNFKAGVTNTAGLFWDGSNISILAANANITGTSGWLGASNLITWTGAAVTISGWTVNATYLAKDTGTAATSAGMSPTDYPFYAGSTYANRATAPFRVSTAGAVMATSGSIGGWTLGTTQIYNLRNAFSVATAGIYIGTDGIALGTAGQAAAEFSVTNAGVLNASSATISGAITATSGTFSGNILVTGTLQTNASVTAGFKFKSTGIEGWNANNLQTVAINANGTGWLGLTGVRGIEWNADGLGTVTVGGINTNSTSLWKGGTGVYANASTTLYVGTSGISLTDQFSVTSGGALTANLGTIGGWNINSTTIYGSYSTFYTGMQKAIAASTLVFFAGATSNVGAGALFSVTTDGKLTATSGAIGGWTLGASTLQSASATGTLDGTAYTTTGIVIGSGSGGFIAAKNFLLKSDGTASFKGDITGASGTFGGTLTMLGTWVGTANITTLGTITTGVWNAGTVTTTGLTVNGNAVLVGGTAMTSGWNRTLDLSASFPVITMGSNGGKWAGIGYDGTSTGQLVVRVAATTNDVFGTGITALTFTNTGAATFAGSITNSGGGTLSAGGYDNASGYVQVATIYNRSTINLLNKAGSGWLPFAAINNAGAEAVYDLAHVGTVSAVSGTFSGAVSIYGANYFYSNQINSGYSTAADNADIWINYQGYNNANTYFRDFRVGDGKQTQLLLVKGSDKTATFAGNVTTPNLIVSTAVYSTTYYAGATTINLRSSTAAGIADLSTTWATLFGGLSVGASYTSSATANTSIISKGAYTSGSVDAVYNVLHLGGDGNLGYGVLLGTRRDATGNLHAKLGVRTNGADVYGLNIDSAGNATFIGSVTSPYFGVTSVEGNGFRFWDNQDNFKISMGVTSTLYQYGPVTDYSIKTQMEATVGSGRGFTWGQNGVKPIAALNAYSGNMQIAGNFVAGGRITEQSSRRYKQEIISLPPQLDKVIALNPVSYVRNDAHELGLIAEEVMEIYPEFATEDGVSYSRIVTVLIAAVKELNEKVVELQRPSRFRELLKKFRIIR